MLVHLSEKEIEATLINPWYITEIDAKLLDELKLEYELVITLENGIFRGGLGEKIADYYGNSIVKA